MQKQTTSPRKRKRAAAAVARRADKVRKNGKSRQELSDIKTLTMRVAALEDALEHTTKAFNNNLTHIRQAFALNDAHIGVLQMVVQDAREGRLQVWPFEDEIVEEYRSRYLKAKEAVDGEPKIEDWYKDWNILHPHYASPYRHGQMIDLEWYHRQYILVSKVLELFRHLSAIATRK